MARGKFNKRGGGKRIDAHSADEIEQRNQRLAEFEENRTKRRSEEEEGTANDDDDNDNGHGDVKQASKQKDESRKLDSAPVHVTSAEEHKKNLKKLEAVRKRREMAEARRKMELEADLAQEIERKAKVSDDVDNDCKMKKKSKEKNIPKLTKIEIKKMKPALMKEALKERNLDIQGNKNILTARLVEYEASR